MHETAHALVTVCRADEILRQVFVYCQPAGLVAVMVLERHCGVMVGTHTWVLDHEELLDRLTLMVDEWNSLPGVDVSVSGLVGKPGQSAAT